MLLGYCGRRLRFLLPNSSRNVVDSMTHLRFFPKEPIFIRLYSSESVLVAENDKPIDTGRSFTVSYLINSCGLSPELALSASKWVQFDTRKRPDSVLSLLREHGFSDAQISIVVKKRPRLLLANPGKNLGPKLEFFGSVGISGTDLAQVICSNPNIVSNQSLERSIIPCYEIITSLRLHENFKVDRFLIGLHKVSTSKVLSNIAPNISVLRALKVPEASISSWVSKRPLLMSFETKKFEKNASKVMSMGFCPSSSSTPFMKALFVVTVVDASEWAQKMKLYSKWGWTEDTFWVAFRKDPDFMRLSEMNFSSKMNLLVNRMGWEPADVAGGSSVLSSSLEKWIMPRCKVIRVLLLKGLIAKADFSLLAGTHKSRKQYFLDKFVVKYQEQVPELLSIFDGKLGLAELGFEFVQKGGAKQLLGKAY